MSLLHRTIFEDKGNIALRLPFTEELRAYHPDGYFPLVEDPITTENKRALIIGMFVIRPGGTRPFTEDLIDDSHQPSSSVYDNDLDWCYNVNGLEGGWLIANSNAIDAFRLGMQYGLVDAVIIGTYSVSGEGVANSNGPGYIWQPYGPLSWESVQRVDNNIIRKVERQRELWQKMGYLSSRKYPAVILYTQSGLKYDGTPDFLQADIFRLKHPTGEPIEVYIVTSQLGAERIKERAGSWDLSDRINDMLLILPPVSDDASAYPSLSMDVTMLPVLLRQQLGMKLVNHDGGNKVLSEHCRAGIISQLNLALGRRLTVRDVLETNNRVSPEKKTLCLSNLNERLSYFFSHSNADGSICRGIPRSLPIISIIEDDLDEIAIFTFSTKGGFDYHKLC